MTTDTEEVVEQSAEQLAQAEKDAEAEFAAGYKKVSGKEPEEPAKPEQTDKDAATVQAPEKSDAEREAEAKVKTEADAKVAEEKRWEGVPAVVREKLQSLDALSGTVSKLSGHIGGLTNATKAIETALKAAKSVTSDAGGASPSEGAVKAALSNPEAWKQLKEDFPDWAGPVEAELAAIRSEIAGSKATVDVKAVKAEIMAELADQMVEDSHPGWGALVKTAPFKKWVSTQAEDVRALTASERPRDAIKLIDKFRADQKTAVDAEATRLKNQKRLEGAVTPQGTAEPPETGIGDEEAFAKGYKKVARAR